MRILLNMPSLLALGLAWCVAMATVTRGDSQETGSDLNLEDPNRVLADDATCEEPINTFDIPVLVSFLGQPDLVTHDEKTALEQQFLESYNGITDSTCGDGTFRTVQNVIIEGGPIDAFNNRFLQSSASRSFAFRYRVQGSCRGCRRDSSLFNEGNRRLAYPWSETLDANTETVLALRGMLNMNGTRRLKKSKKTKTKKSEKSPSKGAGKGGNKGPTPRSGKVPKAKKGETSCDECSNPTDTEFTFEYNVGVQRLRDSGEITNIEKVTGVTEIFDEEDKGGDIGSYFVPAKGKKGGKGHVKKGMKGKGNKR